MTSIAFWFVLCWRSDRELGTCRNVSFPLFSLELALCTEWDSYLLMTATTRLTNFAALNVYGPPCGRTRFLLVITSDCKAKPKADSRPICMELCFWTGIRHRSPDTDAYPKCFAKQLVPALS